MLGVLGLGALVPTAIFINLGIAAGSDLVGGWAYIARAIVWAVVPFIALAVLIKRVTLPRRSLVACLIAALLMTIADWSYVDAMYIRQDAGNLMSSSLWGFQLLGSIVTSIVALGLRKQKIPILNLAVIGVCWIAAGGLILVSRRNFGDFLGAIMWLVLPYWILALPLVRSSWSRRALGVHAVGTLVVTIIGVTGFQQLVSLSDAPGGAQGGIAMMIFFGGQLMVAIATVGAMTQFGS